MTYNPQHIFTAIYELHRLVQQKHYPEDNLFERLPAVLKSVFQVDLCSIYEFSYQQNRLILKHLHGEPQSMLDVVNFQLGKGNVRRIAAHHRPIWGNNPVSASQQVLGKKQVNSLAGIPIIVNGYLIGVMLCGSYAANAFGKREIVLLDLLGGYIGQLLTKNQWIDSRIRERINL